MLLRQHCCNNAEIAMLNLQRLANVHTLKLNLEQVNVALTLDSNSTHIYIYIYHDCCNGNVDTTLKSQRQIHNVLSTLILQRCTTVALA